MRLTGRDAFLSCRAGQCPSIVISSSTMKASHRSLFCVVPAAIAMALTPLGMGTWVCSGDGKPCPPHAHDRAAGVVDKCCCERNAQSACQNCCAKETARKSHSQRRHCPDIYIVTDRDPALTSRSASVPVWSVPVLPPTRLRMQLAITASDRADSPTERPPTSLLPSTTNCRAPPSV